jgi:hypothetical protein
MRKLRTGFSAQNMRYMRKFYLRTEDPALGIGEILDRVVEPFESKTHLKIEKRSQSICWD